jgi:hypothetical protein
MEGYDMGKIKKEEIEIEMKQDIAYPSKRIGLLNSYKIS